MENVELMKLLLRATENHELTPVQSIELNLQMKTMFALENIAKTLEHMDRKGLSVFNTEVV